jgi:sec-independent protein translocase protein TatC
MALVSFPGTAPPYSPEPEEDDDEGAGKMSFLEHLEELRNRLIISLGALLGGFLVALFFIERLVDFVYAPLAVSLNNGGKFIYTEPTEGFMLRMKIAALAGLFVALPIILLQAWRFIAPGLYAHEKRFAIPFVLFSTVFFTLGAAFSHYVVFPWSIIFFASFQRPDMMFMPRVDPVFSLYVRMMLAMGLVFEMPTLAFFLARIGLITPGILIRNFKYAVLVIFIAAAILTPGQDVASQMFMAGPMLVLYGLSIGIAWVFQKRS